MEKLIYLLRHAKAEIAESRQPDHDRALAPRGLVEARRIGRYFAEHDIDPDIILCSTSLRTRQTEIELRREIKLSAATLFLPELYLAPWEELLKTIRAYTDQETQSILLIGHNPGLEECAARLTDELVLLPPGAMSIVGLQSRPYSEVGVSAGQLRGVVSARTLP
jgi:phosphohistidine phosphatase